MRKRGRSDERPLAYRKLNPSLVSSRLAGANSVFTGALPSLVVDFFDDPTLSGFDDIGSAVPVNVTVLAQRRSIPIDLFWK
jgi:hypothetical protein